MIEPLTIVPPVKPKKKAAFKSTSQKREEGCKERRIKNSDVYV